MKPGPVQRLFFAIGLPPGVRKEMAAIIRRLKSGAAGGTFTPAENLHLTVAFIGETTRGADLRAVADSLSPQPFALRLEGLGKFPGRDGDIRWIGVAPNRALSALYAELAAALRAEGFALEDRAFRPHLTLGRRVLLRPDFDEPAFARGIPGWGIPVEKLSLMKSEHLNGREIYTEIHSKYFCPAPPRRAGQSQAEKEIIP